MTAANSNCVILVLAVGPLAPKCEDGLRELEKRGYPIRRGRGFSAIDQGRNQMASEALHDGFDESGDQARRLSDRRPESARFWKRFPGFERKRNRGHNWNFEG